MEGQVGIMRPCEQYRGLVVYRMYQTLPLLPPENGLLITYFRGPIYLSFSPAKLRTHSRFSSLDFFVVSLRTPYAAEHARSTVYYPLGVFINPTRVRGEKYFLGGPAQLPATPLHAHRSHQTKLRCRP